jgi:hypothetical protein
LASSDTRDLAKLVMPSVSVIFSTRRVDTPQQIRSEDPYTTLANADGVGFRRWT